MVFFWCTVPFLTSALALLVFVRRHTISARQVAIFASINIIFNLVVFLLWGSCAYIPRWKIDLEPICFHASDLWQYKNRSPIYVLWLMPWFALAACIV